jgi:hypothetical protein
MNQEVSTKSDQEGQSTWRYYERIVAAIEAENAGIDLSVTANASIVGAISGARRQVDVLIDARWGDDLAMRVIVDAKHYKDKLDIKDIESFLSMMEDCRASRGILYCPHGCSPAAKRRAQDAVTISLLGLDDLDYSWWAVLEDCYGECQKEPRRRARQGIALWDAPHALALGGLWAIIYTGKCDVCHNFHVWCWDCGEKFALRSEGEYECGCGRMWASAIEEELDDKTGKILNAVHLLTLSPGEPVLALDRRALR